VAVGPLVKVGGVTWTQIADVYTSDRRDKILGQAKGRLRIASQFVPTPTGGVGAEFIQEGRREGMVPDHRCGIAGLGVIEEVVAQPAVVVCFRGWNPVNGKADVIFTGHVGIETAVVLFEIGIGWVGGAEER